MINSSLEVKDYLTLQLISLDPVISSCNMRNSIEALSNYSGSIYQSPSSKQIFVNGLKRDSFGVIIDKIGIISAKILLFCHEAWLDPNTRINILAGKKEIRPQGIWNCKNTIILSFFRKELKEMFQRV